MVSDHRSTDPNVAGHQKAPGLQSPQQMPNQAETLLPHLRGSGQGGGTPLRRLISPGAEVRHKAATIRTGEGIRLAGKNIDKRTHHSTYNYILREEFSFSTQTHRPHLGDRKADSTIWCQKLLLGNFFVWGWSVHGIFT
jgi:hypothetical protein